MRTGMAMRKVGRDSEFAYLEAGGGLRKTIVGF